MSKDRVSVFAAGLKDRLPGEYPEVVAGIVDKLGPELAEGEGYFNHSFHLWPVSRYIEDYGALAPVRLGDFVAYAPTRSCSVRRRNEPSVCQAASKI